MGCLEDLVELEVLYLEFLRYSVDLLLEDEVMEALSLLDSVYGVVENLKEGLAFFFLVLVALHLDLVLILQISIALFLAIDLLLDLCLLFYDLILFQQILPVLTYLQLQLFVGLHQFLALLLDLPQKALVLVLLLVQFLNLVFELLDQIEVSRRNLGIVGLDIGILLRMFSGQSLYLIVFLILELLY